MRKIGVVAKVFRYPVSSLGGETPASIAVSKDGVLSDRRFALFDPQTGRPAAPEQEPRWRPALLLEASAGPDGLPQISFPDGRVFGAFSEELGDHLRAHFGFAVVFGVHDAFAEEVPAQMARIAPRYAVSPLHLLTTASLAKLGTLGGLSSPDPRRFRPTVLIETDGGIEGFEENRWVGQAVRIGEHRIAVTEATRRCGMTLAAQPGLAEDANVLRAIMRHNARHLGVYGRLGEEIAGPVTISPGDAVYAES
ncbi:MOSC domain-containing protein [Rhizobium sp. SGZ-381]|uniref:MOSC domain-containing protein n=1 Tax=Rhizobium sp. SGZ-381 TaxID=3342800 RepID=UPI00366CFCE9